jgi:ATP-dependent Clp protease ATP-binding subunit ClpB
MILNELSKQVLAGKVQKDSVIGVSLNDNREIEFINLDEVKI